MRRVHHSVVLALMLTASVHADRLVLKEESYVKGPTVYLRDIAELDGAYAETLADIEIISAANPGDYRRVNAALVASRVRSAGVGLEAIEIAGPEMVRATTLHRDVPKEELAASLRSYIEREMPWHPEDTEVSVPLPTQDVVTRDGLLEIAWRPSPQYAYVGGGAFRGEIYIDGQLERSLTMRANVETYVDVVVARRDISRGQPVSGADIEFRKQAMSTMPSGALTATDEAIGMVAQRTIFTGQVISARSVQPRIAVKRNQLVTVEFTAGGLHVQDQVKIMHDARVGDLVRCQNPKSKEEFQGIVRADGVIVLP